MPLMLHVRGGFCANNFVHITKSLLIEGGIPFSRLPEAVTLFQLCKPKRGSDIGEGVFEPRGENLIVPRSFCRIAVPGITTQAMQAHHTHSGRILWVISRDHATFACGNVFGCIEREA